MTENKKERSAKNLAERSNSVLLIVDIQEKLFPAIDNGRGVVENTKKFVRAAQILDLPIITTEQIKLGDTVEDLAKLLADHPRPIRKRSFDCFGSKEFVNKLEGLDRETIFLAGIETHICVAQTALHALDSYEVHVLADCVSSRNPENKRVGIERCRGEGAVITSVEMAIYELMEKAGTDEFREILPLVK